jgi:hypothetical protein
MKLILTGLLSLLGTIHILKGQQQSSGWFSNQINIHLNTKLGLLAGVNLRSTDKWEQIQVFSMRSGLVFNIKKNLVFASGVEFFQAHKSIDGVSDYFNDLIVWHHILLTNQFHALSILNRIRLEERFLSKIVLRGNKLEKSGSYFNERIRYMIRTIYPFNGKMEFKKGGYAVFHDEIIFNLFHSNTANMQFFDQNRISGGVGYRFSQKFDIEISYLHQYSVRDHNNRLINNVLQLSNFIRL